MKLPAEKSPLQVGFTDALRSSAGVLLPTYLLVSVLLITGAEFVGIPFALSAPIALTCGVVFVTGVEILRRYVLTTRPSGHGQSAVRIFRGIIWLLLWAALPVTLFAAAGAFTRCFGNVCGHTDRFMMFAMLVWSLIAIAMLPMGYRLLNQADWLRARMG